MSFDTTLAWETMDLRPAAARIARLLRPAAMLAAGVAALVLAAGAGVIVWLGMLGAHLPLAWLVVLTPLAVTAGVLLTAVAYRLRITLGMASRPEALAAELLGLAAAGVLTSRAMAHLGDAADVELAWWRRVRALGAAVRLEAHGPARGLLERFGQPTTAALLKLAVIAILVCTALAALITSMLTAGVIEG